MLMAVGPMWNACSARPTMAPRAPAIPSKAASSPTAVATLRALVVAGSPDRGQGHKVCLQQATMQRTDAVATVDATQNQSESPSKETRLFSFQESLPAPELSILWAALGTPGAARRQHPSQSRNAKAAVRPRMCQNMRSASSDTCPAKPFPMSWSPRPSPSDPKPASRPRGGPRDLEEHWHPPPT